MQWRVKNLAKGGGAIWVDSDGWDPQVKGEGVLYIAGSVGKGVIKPCKSIPSFRETIFPHSWAIAVNEEAVGVDAVGLFIVEELNLFGTMVR